ncbi:SH3 domain-containing protein [Coxiella burnetii]|uniref:C40 family peptidase n=1 Tax=Coxiella burnetii TaxID=777 RepID=UPI000163A594|nr:SH3 domain-containing C40 family peptidase [Coxiella burnetii]ATN85509.1 NlpC-P60 family protein [Coxiella burnetii str. Schperling]EDR36256.1 conserved hypothetical protein [Coxiella burnetii Q321]PHH56499.1 NlpC-P60 family protein [Coxiella burnetii]
MRDSVMTTYSKNLFFGGLVMSKSLGTLKKSNSFFNVKRIYRPLFSLLFFGIILLKINYGAADDSTISLFPLDNYDQTLSSWIQSDDPNYDKPLITPAVQEKHLQLFYDHYFGPFSPWNEDYINKILHQSPPDDLKTIEENIIASFSNKDKPSEKINYGENFRPYSSAWIEALSANIDPERLDQLAYQSSNRGIAMTNLNARVLPTTDVAFYDYHLAGQGYPFDNLQMSALWAGTPVYILCETQDRAWSLVVTPHYIAWVKRNGIAHVDEAFINTWTTAAKKQLAAIIHTKTNVIDDQDQFRFLAYVGSVFPATQAAEKIKIMIPVPALNGSAAIGFSTVSTTNAVLMPFEPTPHHMATVITTLMGRPYGWGGMYFYNDCSAELKSLFTPFGVWLPRHSSAQVYAGKMVDMSKGNEEQRLAYLIEKGHHLVTLVYIGGHIVLFIGNYPNPNDPYHATMAMTYQNLWGLSPNPPTRRAVVGEAVFFPMLLQYPEDPSLTSLANRKYFQISYLDELPNYLFKLNTINLKALMAPE